MDLLMQPHNFPGKLIIVEGIDGSGKSTQLQLAMRYLQAKGLRPFFTEWNSADLVKAVTKVSCRIREDRVKCLLSARSDAELEIWGARRKMKFFEKVFGRKITFELAEQTKR